MPQKSLPAEKNDEWIRLPRPRERCQLTGLSRTSLVELLDERDPGTGDFLILQYTKKRHGKQRGIRMINKPSLLEFLRKRAEDECKRKFSPGVSNPEGLSIEQVCSDFDTFVQFADPDAACDREAWSRLKLAEKIQILESLGRLEPTRGAGQ